MQTLFTPSPGPLFGLALVHPHVGALERIGPDWDWFWIDAQHGDLDFRDAVNMVRATDLIARPGLVRAPGQDPSWVSKILDAGAAGVIVPMIESVAEAQAMVRAAKFPPVGNRSYGGLRVSERLGLNYYKSANRDTLLILQVESDEAVALADELAAIEGVDGLFLGPDDLAIRAGREVTAPKNLETCGRQSLRVAESCRRHGKLSIGIGASEAGMEMAKLHGHPLIVGGSDAGFLSAGSKAATERMRAYFNTPPPVAALPRPVRTAWPVRGLAPVPARL